MNTTYLPTASCDDIRMDSGGLDGNAFSRLGAFPRVRLETGNSVGMPSIHMHCGLVI